MKSTNDACRRRASLVPGWIPITLLAVSTGCAPEEPQTSVTQAATSPCSDSVEKITSTGDAIFAKTNVGNTVSVSGISASKPSGASSASIKLDVYHLGHQNELEVSINGNGFVDISSPAPVARRCVEIATPVNHWNNGDNRLVFRYTNNSSKGVKIYGIGAVFQGGSVEDPPGGETPERGLIGSVGPRTQLWSRMNSIIGTPECNNCTPVNVTSSRYGATPDDNSDDDGPAINKALSEGQPVFFPPGIYRTSEAIKLQPGAGMYGRGAHIQSTRSRVLSVTGSRVFVRGMTIESTMTSLNDYKAPKCFESNGKDRFTFEDNTFINCSLKLRNKWEHLDDGHLGPDGPKNIRIAHNKFETVFTTWAKKLEQNDVITLRGFNGVSILSNDFDGVDFLRLIKIADIEKAPTSYKDNYRITPYHSEIS